MNFQISGLIAKVLLTSNILLVCFVLRYAEPRANISSNISLEQQRKDALEELEREKNLIQKRILNRLHMSSAPKGDKMLSNSYRKEIPEVLTMNEKDNTDKYDTILLATKQSQTCYTDIASLCIDISIHDKLPLRSIVSARLVSDMNSIFLIGRTLELHEFHSVGGTIHIGEKIGEQVIGMDHQSQYHLTSQQN